MRGAAFSPDGNRLHVALGEIERRLGGLATWDLASGQRLRELKGLPALRDLRLSPDGQRLLVAADGNVQLWWAR